MTSVLSSAPNSAPQVSPLKSGSQLWNAESRMWDVQCQAGGTAQIQAGRWVGGQMPDAGDRCGIVDPFSKVGIRKKLRRDLPTPQEWEESKKIVERLEQQEIEGNDSIFLWLLRTCSRMKALPEGKRVHALITRSGLELIDGSLGNHLVQMYISCGRLDTAYSAFSRMQQQDVVSWTSMIAAFTQNGYCKQALVLFQQMQLVGVRPDRITFTTILNTCGSLAALQEGKVVHNWVVDSGLGSDVVVATALLKMYSKCGSLEDAKRAFGGIHQHDKISWTAMITAYAENWYFEGALQLFQRMQLEGIELTEVTFASVLNACGSPDVLSEGQKIHAMVVEKGFELDMVVGTAIVSMYSKCGSLEDARSVFDRMPRRDVVLWTAMIGAYVEHVHPKEAFELYREMQLKRVKPNRITYLTMVNACADKAALAEARQIHADIEDHGINEVVMENAIITMYGKCGSLIDARKMFEKMRVKQVVTWNAMAAVYAQNGDANEALELFRRMQQSGVKPNGVTFISILSVCGHAGMVHEGCLVFVSIYRDHGIAPMMEHYSCIVDMLARAGWLEDAERFIKRMPCTPDDGIWASLLGACRVYGDVERSERTAREVLELDPQNSEAFVVLFNSLAAAGRWDDVEIVRKEMAARGVREPPGWSFSSVAV